MHTRASVFSLALLGACGGSMSAPPSSPSPHNPDSAPVVAVDRFSDGFAHLFARSQNASLPAANSPIDFDSGAPFITYGLSPEGQKVSYYNFDVLPAAPAPIYVLFKPGATTPVDGQLNIIDVIPGETGYNDFWQVFKVNVPADYVANTITSADDISKAGFTTEATNMLVNCPVVPDGSSARLRYTAAESPALTRGWYKHQVVKYFTFMERALVTTAANRVPMSDIYVTFTINPDASNPASGPPSGFVTENGTAQTHNVIATLPEDAAYSPLWVIRVYDNSAFASVSSLATAMSAASISAGGALVNCPVVAKQ
jgi:hypothetical protein